VIDAQSLNFVKKWLLFRRVSSFLRPTRRYADAPTREGICPGERHSAVFRTGNKNTQKRSKFTEGPLINQVDAIRHKPEEVRKGSPGSQNKVLLLVRRECGLEDQHEEVARLQVGERRRRANAEAAPDRATNLELHAAGSLDIFCVGAFPAHATHPGMKGHHLETGNFVHVHVNRVLVRKTFCKKFLGSSEC